MNARGQAQAIGRFTVIAASEDVARFCDAAELASVRNASGSAQVPPTYPVSWLRAGTPARPCDRYHHLLVAPASRRARA